MGLAEIKHASDLSAKAAAKNKKVPYVPFDEAEVQETRFIIPNLGSYTPKGWELMEELFCDTSDMGSEGEPALTLKQLKKKIIEYMKMDGTHGFGITEEGQFQCHVGVFKEKT